MIRAAGASFKLRHPTTGVMTEIAQWLTGIDASGDQDREDVAFFNPNALVPVKLTSFGAITLGYTLTGKWKAEVETFFAALAGNLDVPFEFGPEGTGTGKILRQGAVNVGAWTGPTGDAAGSWNFTIELGITYYNVVTTGSTPAAVDVLTSSAANPSLITTDGAHGLSVGDVVVIAGHTGSTPDINMAHTVTTVPTSATFTIPVSVTVAGTGGTVQE